MIRKFTIDEAVLSDPNKPAETSIGISNQHIQ